MNQDNPILEFNVDYGYYHIINPSLLPFPMRGTLKDSEQFPDRVTERKNERTLIEFLSRRVLSLDRENAKKILNAFNLSQSQDPYTKARIAITCKAVSMTDSYWLSSDNNTTWESVNPRNVSLSEIVANIALHGKSLTVQGAPHTPELTNHGAYAKAWKRDNDGVYLYKKGTEKDKEAEREVSASNLLDCVNVEHVRYDFVDSQTLISKCKNMATDQLAMVPAEDVYSYCCRQDMDFMLFANKIDKVAIAKMNIVDYLLSNSDRHMMNWGFYQNNNTGELICCHPLYDHNNAFDEELLWEDKNSLVWPDLSMKEAALKSLKICDFHFTKQIKNAYFVTEEHKESFIKKACDIGIAKIRNNALETTTPIRPYRQINYNTLANAKLEADYDRQ